MSEARGACYVIPSGFEPNKQLKYSSQHMNAQNTCLLRSEKGRKGQLKHANQSLQSDQKPDSCKKHLCTRPQIDIRRIVQIGHNRNTISFIQKKDSNASDSNATIVQLGNNNIVYVYLGDKLPSNILLGDTVVVYVPPGCDGRPRVFVCEQRGPDNQIVTHCRHKSPRIYERQTFGNFLSRHCHVIRSVLLPTASGSSKKAAGRHKPLTPGDCDVVTIKHGGSHRTNTSRRVKPDSRKYLGGSSHRGQGHQKTVNPVCLRIGIP
ncbi:uncharacterized protein LOC124280522 [Haliotis rubra]|uniref:uncharacterized protein LOC124280522 n=1 Tax=Haliotis rubra TaxID=36100 RepID=UPI001EE5C845|nr:uncharacterized protein LOC124280522 [Haliotis rubra]